MKLKAATPTPTVEPTREKAPTRERLPSSVSVVDQAIAQGVRTVLGVASTVPSKETLKQEIEDARNAAKRGCFLPDEDDRVRAAFASYLRSRAALHECIAEMEPFVRQPDSLTERQYLEAFAVAFCAACLLNRTAEFIVSEYARAKVVHRKLDEPEPRYGIPPKQFTKIFKSLTQPYGMWRFQQTIRFAKENEEKLMALRDGGRMEPVIDLLLEEKPHLIDFSRRMYFRKRLRYWLYAYTRGQRSGFKQAMFALFEIVGRAITTPRIPFRSKRVTPEVIAEIRTQLEPGDVLLTREDDNLINYFLPGYWPHTALYIGTEAQRRVLGVEIEVERHARSADPVCVLEARRDGVLFRPLERTLRADSFAVIRPRLSKEEIRTALQRAITHEGKAYDFVCDFRQADRLVCTELIYRAYHAVGNVQFVPVPGTGRYYLSPEQLLDQAIEGENFEVVALYGVNDHELHFGERAEEGLIASCQSVGEGADRAWPEVV